MRQPIFSTAGERSGVPLTVAPSARMGHELEAVERALHIMGSVFAGPRSVVFLTLEALRSDPLGPAHRTEKLAEVVAEHCRVTLAAPSGSSFPKGPFETLEIGPPEHPDLTRALAGHDVVVVQTLPSPRQLLAVRRHAPRLVVDMVAPLALEAAEIAANGGANSAMTRWRMREQIAHLALADLALCTNERQRDLALGAALAARALAHDPSRVPL